MFKRWEHCENGSFSHVCCWSVEPELWSGASSGEMIIGTIISMSMLDGFGGRWSKGLQIDFSFDLHCLMDVIFKSYMQCVLPWCSDEHNLWSSAWILDVIHVSGLMLFMFFVSFLPWSMFWMNFGISCCLPCFLLCECCSEFTCVMINGCVLSLLLSSAHCVLFRCSSIEQLILTWFWWK